MQPKRDRKLYSSGVNIRERCRFDTRDKEACSDLDTRAKQLRTISSGSLGFFVSSSPSHPLIFGFSFVLFFFLLALFCFMFLFRVQKNLVPP